MKYEDYKKREKSFYDALSDDKKDLLDYLENEIDVKYSVHSEDKGITLSGFTKQGRLMEVEMEDFSCSESIKKAFSDFYDCAEDEARDYEQLDDKSYSREEFEDVVCDIANWASMCEDCVTQWEHDMEIGNSEHIFPFKQ